MVKILMRTFFDIFDIEVNFNINSNELRKKYFDLQKKYHPDSSDEEDIEMCLLINEGYRILNDDVKRAFYLLELENIYLNKENSVIKPGQEILLRALETRELLEESNNVSELNDILITSTNELENQKKNFIDFYNNKNFIKAAQIAIEMQYINKLIIEVNNKLHKILE